MGLHERLSALIHPSRARVMRLLSEEELTGGEVARITQSPQSTTSRHLKALTESGWAVGRREGNMVIFGISDQLTELELTLWASLREELSARWPDDAVRLNAILCERAPNSRSYFGRVATGWDEIRRELYGEHSLTHLALSMLDPNLTIADLGCGSGGFLALLAPQARHVIGVDREPTMLKVARERTERFSNVEVREGELEAPPLAVSEVDLALLNLVLHLVEEPERVLRAAQPKLKARGRLIVIDMVAHDRDEYRRTMGHVSLGFSRDQLSELATRAGLKLSAYHTLPPDLSASGPALFTASLITT